MAGEADKEAVLIELPEGKNWFLPQEVARLLGVSRRTVYRWHESGWLQGKRFSPRTLKFRKSEILEFVAKYEDEI